MYAIAPMRDALLGSRALQTDRRKRSALAITQTELKLIASAAIIGDSNQPVNGYSTPAASGMPIAL
jgi:hypothetical protein